MPLITRIVQQKDANRANIYLDGKFAFGITLESLLKHNLHVNKELSSHDINNLKVEDNQAKIINRAIEYSTRRPHSQKEIELWCRKKKVEENIQDKVISKLKKLNLINDLEFAKWWIEQRDTFRPKPVRIIKLELKQKGVSGEIIEEALESVESPSELETARKIAAKKAGRFQRMPYDEGKKKLSNFLAMRGFSWDTIRQILEETLQK